MPLDNYYNLYDSSKKYEELMFRAGDGLQSRELNEMQTMAKAQLKGVGDALLKDGDIIAGVNLTIDSLTGITNITAGTVYLAGLVRTVSATTFTLPIVGIVTVGIRLLQSTITELEDPTLREPATAVRNYQEAGAARLKEVAMFGWDADGGEGQFYPIMVVENGILQNKTRPPVFDGVTQMLARYDYDANGHYIVDGLGVQFVSKDMGTNEYVFMLSSGVANVTGFKVTRDQDQRLRLLIAPDMDSVQSEPHVFVPDGAGKMKIILNRSPLSEVTRITATVEKTVTVTRGAYSGGTDIMPDPTVIEIVSVKQGGTTYTKVTDYTTEGGVVNWSPTSGIEPAPTSSYVVVYRYIKQITSEASDDVSVTVSGAVSNTIVQVDYKYKLPRVDSIVISQNGLVSVVKGVSSIRNAQEPVITADQLRLANISYDWISNNIPSVQSVGVRVVSTSDIQGMKSQINALFDLVAREQLKNDLTIRESASKKGIFVDPFFDNDMRDMGATQDAAIVSGSLMSPISANLVGQYVLTPQILPFVLRTLLEQTARTGSMKINEYASILPMPANVLLTPSQDYWIETDNNFSSDVTTLVARTVNQTIGGGGAVTGVSSTTSSSSSTSVEFMSTASSVIKNMRQIVIAVNVKGFGNKESVSAMRFDGVALSVQTALKADSSGFVSTNFTIPANTPAGTKLFEIEGSGGSYGSAVFVGQGTLNVNTWRNRITTTITTTNTTNTANIVRNVDPLAQTFVLPVSETVAGIELWFSKKGEKDVTVQIRETSLGMPTPRALTEGRISASSIVTNGVTRIVFNTPAILTAGIEYAICILSDDVTHELAIAEIGKFDSIKSRWVTSQPYQVGVLFSSSNNSAWTPHQDKDLTFRLLSANFTQNSQTVAIASNVSVTNMSDLMVFATVERPFGGTDVRFIATLEDGRKFIFSENSGVSLPDSYTGKLDLMAELIGTTQASAVLAPDVLVVYGNMKNEATYISRGITAGTTFSVQIIADVLVYGSSSVSMSIESGTSMTFVPVSFNAGIPLGDGWTEIVWKVGGLAGIGTDKMTRVKATINNSPAYRAQIKNLRVIIT